MEQNIVLIRRMVRALNRMDGAYYYLGRELGVNENTLAFLYALADGGPHSQKEISLEWLIPKTTINTIVKTMAQKGYIVLTSAPHRREKQVSLTPEGQVYADALLGTIYQAEAGAIAATLEKYPPEFVDALEYFSDRFQGAL